MSFTEKVQQKADELKGAAKQKFGETTNDERMQAEGERERSAAKVRQAGEHVKDAGRSAREAFR